MSKFSDVYTTMCTWAVLEMEWGGDIIFSHAQWVQAGSSLISYCLLFLLRLTLCLAQAEKDWMLGSRELPWHFWVQ